jgi:hypothetical protein
LDEDLGAIAVNGVERAEGDDEGGGVDERAAS